MLHIKVLGAGCPNCKKLEAEARAALDSITPPLAYEIVKVTDYAEIAAFGVMSTPALVINDEVVVSGRIPSRQHIIEWAFAHQN